MNYPVEHSWQNVGRANSLLRFPEIWESQRIDGVTIDQAQVKDILTDRDFLFFVGPSEAPTGFLIVQFKQPGIYELHTNLAKAGRGPVGYAAITGALDWMFTATPADTIFTHAPEWNQRPILAMIGACGGHAVGDRPNAWQRDGIAYSSRICAMGLHDWAANRVNSGAFAADGESFHKGIHDALGELSHGEDRTHDAAVGLAVVCGRAGAWNRGIALYNHIAAIMGYQTIRIEGITPDGGFILWMGNAILKISRDMKVVGGWNIKT